MKLLYVTIYLALSSSLALSALQRGKYTYPTDDNELAYNTISRSSVKIYNQISKLQKIKLLILNGEIDKAEILLNNSGTEENFNKKIQLRYMAMIKFIQGNYKEVITGLNEPEMLNIDTLPSTCLLKTLSYAILNKTKLLSKFWKVCRESSISYSDTSLTWMQVIVDLKTSKNRNYVQDLMSQVNIDNTDKEFLRIYLKLALYLNSEDKIIERFKFFGKQPLEDEITRELIGFNYFRNGQLVKAEQLLRGIKSSNAETFRGNIYLYQKKYNLAYAQYKLALQMKGNSQNALERLLPLSWKLKQWNDSLSYVQKIETTSNNETENNTLLAATLTMMKKHKTAEKILQRIRILANKGEPIEVSQLLALNQMELAKTEEIEEYVYDSCAGQDGLNCWYLIASSTWKSLTENLTNEVPIHAKTTDLIDKYTSKVFDDPIIEEIFVSQKNIEEMDNSLINLVPIE